MTSESSLYILADPDLFDAAAADPDVDPGYQNNADPDPQHC